MPKINVYLPDALAGAVKDAGVPVSAVCQAALTDAVAQVRRVRATMAGLREPATPATMLARVAEGTAARMTPRLVNALGIAGDDDAGLPRDVVTSLDLLRGVLADGENLAFRLLVAQGVDADALATTLVTAAAAEPRPDGDTGESLLGRMTMPARGAVAGALEAALDLGHNYLGCEHLLIGLAAGEGPARDSLASYGVGPGPLRQALGAAAAGVLHERSSGRDAATIADLTRRLEALEQRLTAPS